MSKLFNISSVNMDIVSEIIGNKSSIPLLPHVNYVILHHMSDMDGFMSGALMQMVLCYLNLNKIKTIPCSYNKYPSLEEIEDYINGYNNQYVCIVTDLWYSPTNTHMVEFFNKFDRVIFIDHHSTSLEEAKSQITEDSKFTYLYSDLPATAMVYRIFKEWINAFIFRNASLKYNNEEFIQNLVYSISEFDISLSSEQIKHLKNFIYGHQKNITWAEITDYEYFLRYCSKYVNTEMLIKGIVGCTNIQSARDTGFKTKSTYDIISSQIVKKYELKINNFKNEFAGLNNYSVFAICAPNFNNSSLFDSLSDYGVFMTISITQYGLSVNLFSKILDLRKLGFNGHATEAGITIPEVYDIKYIGDIE